MKKFIQINSLSFVSANGFVKRWATCVADVDGRVKNAVIVIRKGGGSYIELAEGEFLARGSRRIGIASATHLRTAPFKDLDAASQERVWTSEVLEVEAGGGQMSILNEMGVAFWDGGENTIDRRVGVRCFTGNKTRGVLR